MPAKTGPQKLHFSAIASPFVVVDAGALSLGTALQLLHSRRLAWLVARDSGNYCVASKKELLSLHKQFGPNISLRELCQEHRIPASSVIVSSRRTAGGEVVVEIPANLAKPSKSRRAVIVRPHATSSAGTNQDQQQTSRPSVGAIGNLVVAKKARKPEKKTLPRLHPISYKSPPSIIAGAHQTFHIVDVFYATDRAPIPPKSPGHLVRYENSLPIVANIDYGICHVTVPKSHQPGKLESPAFWRFELNKDLEKHFTVFGSTQYDSADSFFSQLNDRLSQSPEPSCFVFIHGYNVSFEDAALCAAQLAADLKFPGTPILYSWASRAFELAYPKDSETIQISALNFGQFLSAVTQKTGASKIHVIAHSMGNRALFRALDSIQTIVPPPFEQIVVAAPDIPKQNIEPLIAYAKSHAARLTLYATRKDIPLKFSKWVNQYQRLGRIDGENPEVWPGMDTIDVTRFKGDFWSHSGFVKARNVLADLMHVLKGEAADNRFGLQAGPRSGSWILK